MSRPRYDRQDHLFRPALRDIINLRHPLVRLAEEIDWDFLDRKRSFFPTLWSADRTATCDPCAQIGSHI
jgi:hypothetical protein